jgi:hypothetical protein
VIDLFDDLFDLYQEARIREVAALQADSDRRITDTGKHYIEKVGLADDKLDGKIARKGLAMDCPYCNRRVLKNAVVCPWCSERLQGGNAFEAT